MNWASTPGKGKRACMYFSSSVMGNYCQYRGKVVLAAVASAALSSIVYFASFLANGHQQRLAQKEMYG